MKMNYLKYTGTRFPQGRKGLHLMPWPLPVR